MARDWAGRVRPVRAAIWLLVWLILSSAIASALFLSSERTLDVASHRATIRPDLSGMVVVRTGPVLPDLRADSGSDLGVEIVLGKTDASSVQGLTQRYAAIASHPEPQIDKVRDAVRGLAVDAAIRGGALGAVPLLVWGAVGPRRRADLLRGARSPTGLVVGVVVVLVGVGIAQPWHRDPPANEEDWQSLAEFLGPEIDLPEEAVGIEVLGGAPARQTRRLVESAVSTYQISRTFYDDLTETARSLAFRDPADDETVAIVVSDRHDNTGMDPVARAIADAAGATAVLDAGDDTSTGESWEAFSLDSLAQAFDDYDRWAVAGNHDNGTFVRDYLEDLGWTYFDGEVVPGPRGSRLLGVDDPRSSGLGNWRDETGLSFEDVGARLADAACAADKDGDRVGTLLVHDANLGDEALERGCVDLVVGGHTHVQDGPASVVAENGETGYTYTVGTTGGAAYAIALGSKLRRPAGVALITYRDGRPVGIQSVTVQTTGRFDVGPYVTLSY